MTERTDRVVPAAQLGGEAGGRVMFLGGESAPIELAVAGANKAGLGRQGTQ